MSASHYTYLSHLIHDPDVASVVAGVVVLVSILAIGGSVAAKVVCPKAREIPKDAKDKNGNPILVEGDMRALLASGKDSLEPEEEVLVPSGKANLATVFEAGFSKFVEFHDSIMGPEGRKYIHFTFGIFLFLLVSNLLGLFPGIPSVVGTVRVSVGLAFASFLYFNLHGVKENGLWGYIKHFMGPVPMVALIIFPVEIFSTCLRILTLNLRLYWNIKADHMVLSSLTDSVGVFASLAYALGVFVSFMQAFIFTVLSMVYVKLATAHDDDH